MCPILFKVGPFTIYSYGLMLAIGFISASALMTKEYRRKNLDPNLAGTITLIALVAGVAGSKLLYLLEHWNHFVADPAGLAFSPGGLSFFGGFLLATASIYFYARSKKVSFLTIADGTSPALMLGYGIARLGCHFSGDGDYGFPTTLPWGANYSKGTFPPSEAFKSFPEITSSFSNGIVPDDTLCHPTPVYELLLCILFFSVLWRYRTVITTNGKMFMLYLMFAGFERFLVEFLRINPRVFLGLSEYQLVAAGLFVVGVIGWTTLGKKEGPRRADDFR
jgi:phosphatidylglycerol:prolipoprotein diacylglycerol transferase